MIELKDVQKVMLVALKYLVRSLLPIAQNPQPKSARNVYLR
jgi:hypothetical protein